MISTGLLALVIATVQHVRSTRALRAEYCHVPYSLATIMAALVGALGVVGFISVIW